MSTKTLNFSRESHYNLPNGLVSASLNTSDFILQASKFLQELGNSLDIDSIANAYLKADYIEAIDIILTFAKGISNKLFSDFSEIANEAQENNKIKDNTRQIYEKIIGRKLWEDAVNSNDFQLGIDLLNSFLIHSYDPIITLDKRLLSKDLMVQSNSYRLSSEVKSGIAMRAASKFIDKKIDEEINQYRLKTACETYFDPSQLVDIEVLCQEKKSEKILHNLKIYSNNSLRIIAITECIIRLNGGFSKCNDMYQENIISIQDQGSTQNYLLNIDFLAEVILILDLFHESKITNKYVKEILNGVCGYILKNGQSTIAELQSLFKNSIIKKILKDLKVESGSLFSAQVKLDVLEEITQYSIDSTLMKKTNTFKATERSDRGLKVMKN